MTRWQDTVAKLQKAGPEFNRLSGNFQQFASDVHNQVIAPGFFISGLTCDAPGIDGQLRMSFAGRVVLFIFSTFPGDRGLMAGRVTVFLERQFIEPKFLEIDSFTFDQKGRTSVTDEDGDSIFMTIDAGALGIALHMVAQCLNT